MIRLRTSTRVRGPLTLATAAALLLSAGCLKTLDESLLDDTESGGSGGDGGAASGGAAGQGGSSGTAGAAGAGATGAVAGVGGAGGSAGVAGSGGSGGSGGSMLVPTYTTYDQAAYPASSIVGGVTNVVLGADADDVFRVKRGELNQALLKNSITGGGGTPVTSDPIDLATAVVAPGGTLFVYVASSESGSEDGRISRYLKDPGGMTNDPTNVGFPTPVRRIAGMTLGSEEMLADKKIYLTTRTSAPNQPHVLRIGLGSGPVTAEVLFSAPDANEGGGPVAQQGDCVYWISNGSVYVMPRDPGQRSDALDTQVTDAVGLAADGDNFYYTRLDGSVWQRQLSSSACQGGGAPELMLVSGFEQPGEVVAWQGHMAFIAKGSDYGDGDGGIFKLAAGTADIVQIAPDNMNPPNTLVESGSYVIFARQDGTVARVNKEAQ